MVEYGIGGKTSTKGDVYSYGILLLEMLTGKRPTNELFTNGQSLHEFSMLALPERVMEIVDSRMPLQESVEAEMDAQKDRTKLSQWQDQGQQLCARTLSACCLKCYRHSFCTSLKIRRHSRRSLASFVRSELELHH
ncbi:hypothetical protein RHMOL_Rhmol09G0235000 [Rhododendron molle]|uniref:Uncharacterized protein n=1 Tax=Rhododendron molle TaxID=49168 RepID=A0ACC0MH43_RHOML|nr:hypothetical protein RHMOL_Rhmol09G0235000 [Rhododendron molle]